MADYKLHCVGASGNAYKVALFLACAGLDWEPIGIDIAGGQTRDAGWREGVNAMGEIPVLEAAGEKTLAVGRHSDVACGNDRQVCAREQ